MLSLLMKTTEMERLIETDMPKTDKIIHVSQKLSGLELSSLSGKVRKYINRELIALNGILSKYPIKTFDDYAQIIPRDLDQMIQGLGRICQKLKSFSKNNLSTDNAA